MRWLAFAAEIVLLNHRIKKYPYWGAELVAMKERRSALVEWFEFELDRINLRRRNAFDAATVQGETTPTR